MYIYILYIYIQYAKDKSFHPPKHVDYHVVTQRPKKTGNQGNETMHLVKLLITVSVQANITYSSFLL